jgi:hypothetical protein
VVPGDSLLLDAVLPPISPTSSTPTNTAVNVPACGGEVGERSGEVDEVGQGDNEGSGTDDVTLSPTTIALRVALDGGEGGDIDAHLDAVLAQLDA